MFLSKFYILSAHRGKGLGRRAMAFIEKLAIIIGEGCQWLFADP
ncbi:MAG: GNAT family N-acetyltransferase [Anaerolineales bacterium]